MFEEQMKGTTEFTEAEHIIWDLQNPGSDEYQITSSGNLIKKEEIISSEWDSEIEAGNEDV